MNQKVKKFLKSPKRLMLIVLSVLVIAPAAKIGDDFFEVSKNLEIFSELYKNINMYYADDTRPGELMKTGIDAMLVSLDPYTNYIPESKMEDYRFMTTGQYGGIGSLIRTIDEGVYISEPYQDFPAQKNGLQAGDRIVRVDGIVVDGKKQDEISDVLKGSPGSTVKLEVEREGTGKVEFMIKREEIKIPDVPYKGMLDEKTGYIKLNGFTNTASKEVKEAFAALKTEGMEQLIFDLRGNGGGLLQEAINIVNVFVPRGTEVVSTKGKIEQWNRGYKALNEPLTIDMPVAVLIDGGSASASEIVSGTLQDLDRAIVVGNQSFGKGLVQQTKDIPYGSKLKLTVAKYYTPSGRCIQKLDYTNRTDGKVEEVPDSLIREFKTRNGRPVFDGKGIDPDIEIEREALGKIVGGVYKGHHFFKYANTYHREHADIPADFKLSEVEFEAFVTWLEGQEVSYSTDTQDALDELIETAKTEKYYDESSSELDELREEMKPNLSEDALKFKKQMTEILESEIIARYRYQDGRMEHSLRDDPAINAALENLVPEKYKQVLKG